MYEDISSTEPVVYEYMSNPKPAAYTCKLKYSLPPEIGACASGRRLTAPISHHHVQRLPYIYKHINNDWLLFSPVDYVHAYISAVYVCIGATRREVAYGIGLRWALRLLEENV